MAIIGCLGVAGGIGIIFATCYLAVIAAPGGYADPQTVVTYSALAGGLTIGAVMVAGLLHWRWHASAGLLMVCLLGGELLALQTTGERVLQHRADTSAPRAADAATRRRAADRVTRAEHAVARLGTSTPRLDVALVAQRAASEALTTKSAERYCASQCRLALQAEVARASAEVDAARREIAATRSAAMAELNNARSALAALPAPRPASSLAQVLGWPAWVMDLSYAGLASVAFNGLGAVMLGVGSHVLLHSHTPPPGVPPTPSTILLHRHSQMSRRNEAPSHADVSRHDETAKLPAPERDVLREAARYATDTMQPARDGALRLVEMRDGYRIWCREQGLEPFSEEDIDKALANLFARHGRKKIGKGTDAVMPGISWRQKHIEAAE